MMNSYAECGLRIDGTTLGTNDKGELSVIGGSGGNDKPRQISLYGEQGNVVAQLTIEAEGGKASLHFSGTSTDVPIILSGVDTPTFDGDSANKKYVDDGLNTKVDKEAGKGLSEEDFTVELKTKLEDIVELPVVTATDNGKILKVVNGAWAVADA